MERVIDLFHFLFNITCILTLMWAMCYGATLLCLPVSAVISFWVGVVITYIVMVNISQLETFGNQKGASLKIDP